MGVESIRLEARRTDAALELVVVGDATIATAHALRDGLIAQLPAGGDVALVLDGVSRMDAAGVQLLVSARKSVVARGGRVTIQAAEGPALRALRTSGALDVATAVSAKEAHR